jgi:hypothetical protein
MKDSNDHIKELFSDFEPEADDATIQQGWDEVRYFLPQEKKRRGFIFWKYAGLSAAFIAVVLLPLGWYFYNAENPVAVVRAKENKNASEKSTHSFKAEDKTHVTPTFSTPVIPPGDQKPFVNKEAASTAEPTKATPGTKNDLTVQVAGPGKNLSSNGLAVIPPSVKQPVPAAPLITPETGTTENKQENKTASQSQAVTEAAVPVESIAAKPIVFLPMHETVLPVRDEPFLTATITPLPPLPLPVKEKFSVQVFGGVGYTSTDLRYFKFDDRQKHTGIQPSFGALAAYQFRNKVSVLAQFIFLQNKTTYTRNREEDLKVYQKTVPITSLVPDSIERYVKATTTTRLKFSPAYNLALGLEYPVWQNRKTEVSASLLMNLSMIKYRFEENYKQETDTLMFVTNTVPTAYAPPVAPVDQRFSESVRSLGLLPGITVSYKLYKNLALVAKPSYLLQVTERKKVVQNLFDLKQNTFFMNVGIRLRW